MSSSSFNVIRKHSIAATNVRIKELTQELAKQRSDISGSQLETDDVRSQGRMDHSTIKVNDERLKFVTTLNNTDGDFNYEFPNEPDHSFLKVWFMLDHLGARMRDMSGFGNDAHIQGHPTLRRVGLDLGFQQTALGGGTSATPVMLFNSGTDVVSQKDGEYIYVVDNPSIQFIRFSAGFSITCRFSCLNFNLHTPDPSEPDEVWSRRIASKTDDPSNGWNLVVYSTNSAGTTGGIEFEIMDNGVQYVRKTTGYNAGSFYQLVITYNPNAGSTSAARIKIYTAGVENSSDSTFGTSLATVTNLRIGARSSNTGFFHGYIHDFRLYMGKVLTQTEVTNINQNEMTIDNITKNHVFVVQYAFVSTLMRRKTHKYNIGGDVKRDKIHKFNITAKITRAKIHKYSLLNSVTRARIHKYNINTLVSRVRTHKYHMEGVIQVSRIHKYNMGGVISTTKTHKYNISNDVLLYDVSGTETGFTMMTTATSGYRASGTKITTTSHPLYHKVPRKVIVNLDGRGMTDGTVYCRIYASNGITIRKTIASKPVSSLGNGKTSFTFEDLTMTSADQLELDEYLVIDVENIPVTTNYILGYRLTSDVLANTQLYRYLNGTGWETNATNDWPAQVYGF